RGGKRAHGASGGGRGGSDRQTRPGGARSGEGLRRAEARVRAERGAAARPARFRAHAARRRRRAEGNRLRRQFAEDAQRQDHAPAAQGAGTGAARGRHFDAGGGPVSLSRAEAIDRLRQMVRIRRFEEKCAELYSAGKIRGFLHLYIGEEAVAAGAMPALTDDDAVVATYREHGQALARGVPAGPIMAEMFGRREGCSKGRGGSMHLFDVSRRFYGGNAIVGGGLPVAAGLALADKLQRR